MLQSNSTDQLKNAGKATGTFYFKQFKVKDDRSTMKVGTDAVLLGAAVDVAGAETILEIGTGCGVIALMLAQRSNAKIDAIDIDAESVKQARENAEQSPWKEQVTVIQASMQDYTRECRKKYDLIVSNPPYFSNSLKSSIENRNISRHNDKLNFTDLTYCSVKLMKKDAGLWVVLPVKESEYFIETSAGHGLYVHHEIKIFPKEGRHQHRNIFELKRLLNAEVNEIKLLIKNLYGGYTKDYIELTKEFYLDF